MGLGVPIVNAPMGGAAGGRLAAAVSRAGGLGMVGTGSSATAAVLGRELAAFDAPGLPVGIGLVHWVMMADPGLLEVALTARPALLSVSFGDDWTWVDTAHAAGVTVAAQPAGTVRRIGAPAPILETAVDMFAGCAVICAYPCRNRRTRRGFRAAPEISSMSRSMITSR